MKEKKNFTNDKTNSAHWRTMLWLGLFTHCYTFDNEIKIFSPCFSVNFIFALVKVRSKICVVKVAISYFGFHHCILDLNLIRWLKSKPKSSTSNLTTSSLLQFLVVGAKSDVLVTSNKMKSALNFKNKLKILKLQFLIKYRSGKSQLYASSL